MTRSIAAIFLALMLGAMALAQPAPAPLFDTSYRPSATISARLQRQFLSDVRWSAGAQMRDRLTEAFAERKPVEIWSSLVAKDGLAPNNVVDALTSYWVLNWITANGAYGARIDNEPIRRQLAAAFAADPNFRTMADQQRQELAEGYMLQFLVQHAALNAAVERRDTTALFELSTAAVANFRQQMGVNLLALVPGPEGFGPKRLSAPEEESASSPSR